MKVYQSLDVEVSFQSCLPKWIVILKGKEQDIELAFNGFFNFCAANGELNWRDGSARSVATFYSSPRKMEKFFYLRELLKTDQEDHSRAYAKEQMEIFEQSKTTFIRFGISLDSTEGYSIGTAAAEKPDYDGKDLAIFAGQKAIDNAPEKE